MSERDRPSGSSGVDRGTRDSEDTLVAARSVTLARAGREVVRDLDLELRPGEIAALLGPNGAGKSTLLEGLAGLLPPAGGTVERAGRVALALQSPDLARRSVRANVEVALRWWGVPKAERRERAAAALGAMRADHLADRRADTLSGGERRRVHLARAVAVRPGALLLDEPFAGLDAATRATLLDDTGAALRASAATTLVVVHDRAEAWALADRLLVMLDGRLVADGAPRDVLECPPTAEVARFLGFDGELRRDDGSVLLTRPGHVTLDPDGELEASVVRLIPLEDGLRVEMRVEPGGDRLFALAPLSGLTLGERVRLRVGGGAAFPRQAAVPPPVQPVSP